jgi:DNA-binding MarR family transcriptional regulator
MQIVDEFQRLDPGMPLGCVDVFVQVMALDRPTSQEIAEAVGASRSTASRHTQELADRPRKVIRDGKPVIEPGHGLIEGHEDPLNRAMKRFRLTPKGRELANRLTGIINA